MVVLYSQACKSLVVDVPFRLATSNNRENSRKSIEHSGFFLKIFCLALLRWIFYFYCLPCWAELETRILQRNKRLLGCGERVRFGRVSDLWLWLCVVACWLGSLLHVPPRCRRWWFSGILTFWFLPCCVLFLIFCWLPCCVEFLSRYCLNEMNFFKANLKMKALCLIIFGQKSKLPYRFEFFAPLALSIWKVCLNVL